QDDLFQPRQVLPRFVRRGYVGLADNLDQGDTGTIEVDGRPLAAVSEAVVKALAGVFFHVHASDANALGAASSRNLDVAVFGQRLVVLRNLVALGQVGIEVVLAGEDRSLVDPAVKRHRR